ncbi:hypothetical protein BJX65DRAFT_298597 [Aspergillus insuetus]
MEKLPLELLSMIFTELDPHSLMNVRRVNKLAYLSVQSVPQLRMIVKYAPTVLRNLHDKLYTTACETCGDYGGYLYLITCRRVCYLCFTQEQSYLPLLQVDVMRKFALRPEHVASLPKIKSIPGYYSDARYKMSKRFTLFDHDAARETGLALYGSEAAMRQSAAAILSDKMDHYESRISQQTAGTRNRTPRKPRISDEPDNGFRNPKRFMAIVRAPSLDRSGALEWGFHCAACQRHYYSSARELDRNIQYTAETFETHILESGEIIDGWHCR